MRVALVACGEMGAAMARRLKERGAEVFTSLAGRSASSRARAALAGVEIIDDDSMLVARTEVFLSVVPPAAAVTVAERFAPWLAQSGGTTVYADCNAIAPATVRRIASLIAGNRCPFVDASIIGGPPKPDDPGPRLYASGEAAARLAKLKAFGIDVRNMGGEIGRASALKLAYASLTKGLSALALAAARGAGAAGVSRELAAELRASQSVMAGLLARSVPRACPKAHRFVGEMEEIACFLGDSPAAEMFRGAAAVYREVAAAWQDAEAAAGLSREVSAVFPNEPRTERAA